MREGVFVTRQTSDLRIRELVPLIAPKALAKEYPMSDRAADTVYEARSQIIDILQKKDKFAILVENQSKLLV